MRKGLLLRDRDALGRELESARVDPAGAVVQHAADLAAQERVVVLERGEVADRLDAGCLQLLVPARADPRQEAKRQRRQEGCFPPGPYHHQAGGLPPVGRDLCDDLRRGDAQRAREPRARAHDGLHRLGERPRVVEGGRDLAEVEVTLVDARLLDRRHDLAHDRPDLARVLAVERMPRPHEHRRRAAAQRLRARHRRADAVAPRDVVRGRDDPASVRITADDERQAPELRVLELLDGGEEGVQVEVRDDHRASA